MSALSDLQKKLEKESQGIMFPFSANASTVSTKQNVYDSATDGIMTMTGQKYVGPDAVVQYGTEEQGYPRQLKQIEAPMLPQFDATQFPKAGEGIMQTPTPAPTPPVETEPEAPAMDPCPPGFKFDPVKKVCVPIEQPKEDRNDIIIDRRRNIGDTANALGQVTDAINSLPGEQGEKLKGTYGKDVNLTVNNDIPWLKFIPLIGTPLNMYLKNKADKQLQTLNGTEGISITKNKDGTYNVNVTEEKGKANFGRLQTKESLAGNMASTQKKDATGNIVKAPNGQNMIQGPLTLSAFGKTNLFAPENQITMPRDAAGNIIRNEATETAFRKKLQDRTQTVDALNAEEKNKLLSELDAALGLDSTATTSKPEKFGTLDTGKITIEDLPSIMPDEGDTVLESGELVTQKRIPKIIQKLNNIKNSYLTETDSRRKEQKRIEYETALDNADTVFETSIKQTSGSELNSAQKQYIDSDNRKARAGESKNKDGSLDSRKGFVKGRENSGYGFRATSANSTKQKDGTITFDQRFK